MQYDPIKKSLGNVFNKNAFLRVSFYKLLDLLLLRTWHIKKEIKNLKKTLSGNSYFLDAGSGYGQYSHFLGRKFRDAKIYAVDVKEEQIKDCNLFFSKTSMADRVVFEVADLTLYSEKDKYKLILSVDVMEHIEEDVKVFQNFYFSLKKGGVLLISTPSDQGGSDVHDDHEESFIDEHVRDGYNINEIEDKLRSVGFTEVESRYSYGSPGKISWRLSMKYPISLLNISKVFFIILPFYYLITFPISLILNYLDIKFRHKTGTGLIVKAIK
ncbi:MAG: class I SAM-dependent methyltransferase [Bacteroidales bacterium]|nr:class I SAM-dependent methyltransferase [Bacteroidales bacterium]MCF8389233.1 class I SAM-dependent methyltransferase [Bacteroidales bacterium]